jgi:hypothetical protein
MMDMPYIEFLKIDRVAIYQKSNADLINKRIKGYRGTQDQWYPLLTIKINDIEANEILMVFGSIEATNDTGRNYSIVSRIVVNDSYNDMPGQNGAFAIGGGGGGNVNNQRHHEQLYKSAIWLSNNYYSQKYVTLMGRAVSSAWKPGDMIDFTQAHADFAVLRFKTKDEK